MASTIKVDNIQDQDGNNIINENANTITIGASGDTVTLASGASQSGFGRSGTVDWDTTAKTASFTAVSGNGYFVNTTSGAITVTLPAGSAGDIVAVSDYASTAQTNNIIIAPNGTDKINGVNNSYYISTQGLAVTLVYTDATKGWKSVTGSDADSTGIVPAFVTATGGTVTTVCTNFKVHTFTSPGTFTVTCAGNAAGSNTVSYMVVAGGGGGANNRGGGGAGGGFREGKASSDCYTASPLNAPAGLPVTATAFPITVGGGGAGTPESNSGFLGTPGSNSIFSTITSTGGGGGGTGKNTPSRTGLTGGSGGGGGSGNDVGGPGGSGNTPPVSPPQGNPGGNAVGGAPGPSRKAGGGGGATVAGTNGVACACFGGGGAGATTVITGSPVAYAGGGGGGVCTCEGGPGGTGGGGNGGKDNGPSAAGTTNTGGGGGGGGRENTSHADGSAGGSGIVIIRYKFQ